MGQDLEVEPGVTVGDWLMRELSTHDYIETEPWPWRRPMTDEGADLGLAGAGHSLTCQAADLRALTGPP